MIGGECGLLDEARMKIPRQIPDGKFIIFQLDENPQRMVKI